jgi:hypothetical protein
LLSKQALRVFSGILFRSCREGINSANLTSVGGFIFSPGNDQDPVSSVPLLSVDALDALLLANDLAIKSEEPSF